MARKIKSKLAKIKKEYNDLNASSDNAQQKNNAQAKNKHKI